jgi:hypothetical protein
MNFHLFKSVNDIMDKYHATNASLKRTLDRYGVAIIPSVLNDTECERIVNGLWDFVELITSKWATPIDRRDERTWRSFYDTFPSHSMLMQHYGIGHAQVCWDARQNPKIVDSFASLWGCERENLLVSFDGASLHLPPETTNRGYYRGNTWYHTDQSYTRNNFECVQAWVTGLDVNPGDATLSVLEGSHRYHRVVGEWFKLTSKNDWYRLTREQEECYVKDLGCRPVNITCPKGSVIFWDSRTIHCGIESRRNRREPNMRAVIYLCYTPRSLATENQLTKKRKACQELRTTSHWPHKIRQFSKLPHTYGKHLQPIVSIPQPILTPLGRLLAGYEQP